MDALRRAVIILAKGTGWGLAEILDLDLEEFWKWLEQLQIVQNEIAEAMRP